MRISLSLSRLIASTLVLLAAAVAGASSESSLSYYQTNDGATYAYTFTEPKSDKPTFLLLHGFPSSHQSWDHQVAALSKAGYGTLAPDLLGFGWSDMPTEPEHYRAKRLADHLIELLEHLDLTTVVGVSHDWGSVVMSRFAIYHQDRLEKLVWVGTGYQALGFLDIDAINTLWQETLGYTPFSYFYFMDRFDAGGIIRKHLESFWHIMYPENSKIWRTGFSGLGQLRRWLNADTKTKDAPWIGMQHKADWFKWMNRSNATDSGINIYRSQLRGINHDDEAGLTQQDQLLHVPNLVIGGADDLVTVADWQIEGTRLYAAAEFDSVTIPGGHWLPMERPDEVSKLIRNFADRKF